MKKLGLIVAVAAFAAMTLTGLASAQNIGVGLLWEGSGITPDMVLPIKLGEDMVIQPVVGFDAVKDVKTEFRFGASFEKHLNTDPTTGLFGAKIYADFTSPSKPSSSAIPEDKSYLDLTFTVFLGATAKLADNVSLVGQWGPYLTAVGERKESLHGVETVTAKSTTLIGSAASLTLRWWIFGK